MRDFYDALVIGFGPAATLVARAVAESGGRVAMIGTPRGLRREASDWIDYWLIPDEPAGQQLLARLGMTNAAVAEITSERLPLRHADADGVADSDAGQARLVAIEDFARACREAVEGSPQIDLFERYALDQYLYEGERIVGAQAIARGGDVVELVARVVADTTRACARVEVRPTECGLFDAVLWGRYRGVSSPSAGAWTFSGRDQSRFWLVPITPQETHLGVEVFGQPAARLLSAAQLWEDELVGCPALAQRLMDAQLLESCELQKAVFAHGFGVSMPGHRMLEEIAAPTPLAFRWSTLGKALELAESFVAEIALERK